MSLLLRLGLRCAGVGAIALGLACTEVGSSEEGETGEVVPPPSFIDLEGDTVEVSARTHTDISFAVADLRPDTQLEFDGEGRLPGGGAAGWLDVDVDVDAGLLHVPLGGALLVGSHELALRHEVDDELLRSELVRIEVAASELAPLSASLASEPVGQGDRLVTHGQGAAVVLGLVDSEAQSVTVRAGAWSSVAFELELPGLGAGAGLASEGAVDLEISTPADTRWVVAGWLGGDGRQAFARIVEIDGPGAPISDPGPVLTLWDLDDPDQVASLGPHQLARLGELALLDRTLVLSVEARRNAEQATPGDHLLVTRYLSAQGLPGAPILVRGAGGSDLDLPGQARSWTGLSARSALTLRADLGFTRRLSLADNGLPRIEAERFEAEGAVPATSVWLRSAEGAFGARHVFSLELGGELAKLRVLRLDRWRGAPDDEGDEGDEGDEAAPSGVGSELIELPALPSAAPWLTALDGVPTLLVPLGPEQEVLALRSTGAGTAVEPVAGLRCDAIGVSSPGDDGVGDTLPLACLREGQLWLGVLGED